MDNNQTGSGNMGQGGDTNRQDQDKQQGVDRQQNQQGGADSVRKGSNDATGNDAGGGDAGSTGGGTSGGSASGGTTGS